MHYTFLFGLAVFLLAMFAVFYVAAGREAKRTREKTSRQQEEDLLRKREEIEAAAHARGLVTWAEARTAPTFAWRQALVNTLFLYHAEATIEGSERLEMFARTIGEALEQHAGPTQSVRTGPIQVEDYTRIAKERLSRSSS
jgi:hypothetical protein